MQLHEYYQKLFPFDLMCELLTASPTMPLTHREFALFFQRDGVLKCQRRIAFENRDKFLRRVLATDPLTIDIGAVHAVPPQHLRCLNSSNVRTRRELVFDLDLCDYDEVRFCSCVKSEKKTSCENCWLFVDIAVQIMDFLLENKFGLVHRFWVFSGSKGVHCWVLDSTAVGFSKEMRQYICNYLEFSQETDFFECPLLRRCYDEIVFPFFRERVFPYVPRNAMLDHLVYYAKRFLTSEVQDFLQTAIASGDALSTCVEKLDRFTKGAFSRLHYPVFIFRFLAPRLDQNVTVSPNHLLKSPFAVHKHTQALALPMSSAEIRRFVPSEAIGLAHTGKQIAHAIANSTDYLRGVLALSRPIPLLHVCTVCLDTTAAVEDLHAGMVYDVVGYLREHYAEQHPSHHFEASQNTLEFFVARQCSTLLSAEENRYYEIRWRRRLQDLCLL